MAKREDPSTSGVTPLGGRGLPVERVLSPVELQKGQVARRLQGQHWLWRWGHWRPKEGVGMGGAEGGTPGSLGLGSRWTMSLLHRIPAYYCPVKA